MKIAKRLATVPFAALMSVAVQAQQVPSPADQAAAARANAEQDRQAQQRDAAVHAPAVRSDLPRVEAYPAIPAETPCFRIDRFALDVPSSLPDAVKIQGASALPLDRFAFAREWLDRYAGACVGKQGIDVLVKGLSQAIPARGYVTTRVLLPEQDLSSGTLKFSLIPGVIRHVRFADEKLRGTWKTAFPTGDGELLNLRDLEQGLEQMKRISSQDVSMQIVPADVPGESDVVPDVKRGNAWATASMNSSSSAIRSRR